MELLERLGQRGAHVGADQCRCQPLPSRNSFRPLQKKSSVIDPISLGQVLFAKGDFEGALEAYRQIDLTGMPASERAPIQYMIATCLRRLGQLAEAEKLYRQVADTKGDEVLANLAQWQLDSLRWRREMQQKLDAMHKRMQSLETP
ncbi:MAG: hypothetical protein KatS3mg105_0762 [Gemmatales bacterium]|nr:MAG: hypothetical protein KatS3mg105_0762 [Gemmatales bacterium]